MSATELLMAFGIPAPCGNCWAPPAAMKRLCPTFWKIPCASCMAVSTVSGN
eukprot:CAMPEP_0177214502 /NCGR_PEP_ID=MMETSP0367-20130122/33725_1 /TAXON_ID=447022 ORGANISM="Scrippsiella hangoei-like, Strain SHHI-4" /NCGR_SAMPLE_ID=MMETSP0367 /ASSEMBLY_ACC=CAM_ASM_000362 /LENGTH=50 /DNA_ID=CAMNT_0018663889 /DNA_START=22 /DNA_END=171 /DNA_ORIENTATION=-